MNGVESQLIVTALLHGLWIGWVLVLPPLLAGALAGATVGGLAGSMGVQDANVARVARILVVVAAIAACGSWWAHELVEVARESWSALAGVDGPTSSIE